MKDHEKAKLVNDLKAEVKRLCPDAPQQLRAVISRVVSENIKTNETEDDYLRTITYILVYLREIKKQYQNLNSTEKYIIEELEGLQERILENSAGN